MCFQEKLPGQIVEVQNSTLEWLSCVSLGSFLCQLDRTQPYWTRVKYFEFSQRFGMEFSSKTVGTMSRKFFDIGLERS